MSNSGGWAIYSAGGNSLIDSNSGVVKEHRIVLTLKNLGGSITDQSYGDVGIVTGYMKKPFTYSTAAQYSKIFNTNFSQLIPQLLGNLASDYTQRNLPLDAGYLSKKVFDPAASYLKLDLEFRIYDDPTVVDKCDLLATCCWPIANKNMALLATEATDALTQVGAAPFVALGSSVRAAADTDGFLPAAGTFVNKLYTEALDRFTAKMPPHVDVQIGTYFERLDMVITNVDITFSTEFTRDGSITYPTYADIAITVESLYASVGISDTDEKGNPSTKEKTFGSGFRTGRKASRVIIDKSNSADPLAKGVEDIVAKTTQLFSTSAWSP